ncbi:sulfhydryl oxidase 1-like isoform X1 [Dysidea avara]|uniref:sulfhydryl oxidase 1-like isoform X1 n=1 Tax=Dysidea avara TaxID=196820 RepID=UPI00332C803D
MMSQGVHKSPLYVASQSEQLLANHLSVTTFPSLLLINEQDTHVYNKDTMATSDIRRGFLEAMLQWNSTVSIVRKPQYTDQSNRQQNNDNVIMVKTSKQRDVVMAPPIRPHLMDLQSAVAYTFRREVPLHSIVSGAAFSALTQFVQLLEQVFALLDRPTRDALQNINFQLNSRKQAGFMLSRDWVKLLDIKLDPSMSVLPMEPQWRSCVGTEPHYRGYPCGLWTLLHTVTIQCMPQIHITNVVVRPHYRPWHISSREALLIAKNYVENFFTCEKCREHFSEMARVVLYEAGDDVSAILWLWQAHNRVNKRLANDISTDPAHPKVQFPTPQLCQSCYVNDTDGSSHWNNTAVFFYLLDFYSLGTINITNPKTIDFITGQLWLYQADRGSHFTAVSMEPSSFSMTDLSLCILLYVLMAVVLLLCFAHLYYKRRKRKPAKFVV